MTQHYVLIVEFCDPDLAGPFDSPEERDAEAVKIRTADDFAEDGMVFRLNVNDASNLSVWPYVGGDFE